MNDRTARIAATLGIAPFACALAIITGEGTPIALGLFKNQTQCAFTVGLVASAAIALVLWWNFIRWRPRSRALTVAAGIVVVIHVAAFQPLWFLGCSTTEEYLAGMQSVGLYGIWRFVCPLFWWGGFIFLRRRSPRRVGGRRPMTATAIRLIVGLALIPLIPAIWYVLQTGLTTQTSWSDELAFTTSLFVSIVIAAALWLLIWRPVVGWGRRTIVGTTGLGLAFALSAFVPYWQEVDQTIDAVVYSAPAWMWGLWMFGTAWLWRDRSGVAAQADAADDDPSAVALPCPQCAYSLRGLTEARCPECGWRGTLDAVFVRSIVPEV